MPAKVLVKSYVFNDVATFKVLKCAFLVYTLGLIYLD